jgi:putative protein-disulfide isomerase
MQRAKVIFVTDPMCSWCWGMAPEIERARRDGDAEFEFDCLLGGINVGSTHPVSDFARARLADVWRRVVSVTQARFGEGLPRGDFVYNSVPACIAVEAMRELGGAPPFDFLFRLQTRFFVEGANLGEESILAAEAVAMGADEARFLAACRSPATLARVEAGFEVAKAFGTSALPSVQVDVGGKRGLVAGGYVDAPTLLESVRGHLRRVERLAERL